MLRASRQTSLQRTSGTRDDLVTELRRRRIDVCECLIRRNEVRDFPQFGERPIDFRGLQLQLGLLRAGPKV
jgi:hypothetical protein